MKPVKSLLLKTYGKQMRKVSAWISPEDRKRAFESTSSDDSVFESARPTRTRRNQTRVCSQKVRPAKKKATQQLIERSYDEDSLINENFILSHPNQPAQENFKTRGKKASVFSCTAGHPVQKKAKLRSRETSSSEETFSRGSCTLNKKVLRKSRLVSAPALTKRKHHKITFTSDSEEENVAPKFKKKSVKASTDSNVLLSAGRFVTRRRCAGLTGIAKATATAHSSSDDFTSDRVFRPTRRRKAPLAFGLCSSESSMNDVGMSNCSANPLQEISLNTSVERSLGPCLRKPIFCSTPSAGFFRKQGPSEAFPTCDQGSSPPSVSVSYIGASHEDLFSSRQPVLPAQSESICGLPSEDRRQSERDLYHIEEQSVELFVEPKESGCSEARSVGGAPSVENLVSVDSDGSSCFVSAAGGLEWPIEALKEECLNRRCTVSLDRLGLVFVSKLGDTTYSSCLERPTSASSLQTASLRHLVENCKGLNWASSDLHQEQTSPSVDQNNSSDRLIARATKDLLESDVDSTYLSDFLCDVIPSPHSPAGTCVSKKSLVSLEKQQLKDITQPKDAAMAVTMLPSQDANRQTDAKRVREHTVAQRAEINKKAAGEMCDPERSALPLKKNCPVVQTCAAGPVVQVERIRLSKLKEILQIADAELKSTDVSESDGDRQAKTALQSDDDENTSTSKPNVRRRKTSSGERNSCRGAPKLKKKPGRDKKRTSTLADASNTTRKACVSGMSVSRWKNKGGDFRSRAEQTGRSKTVDSSISELISAQWKQPQEFLTNTENVFTPLKANLPPLLANLTPSTHTWSRIKAALSVHRKGIVQLTPKSLRLSETPRRTALANMCQDLFASPLRTPLPKHLRSQLLSQHSLVVCEEEELSDAEKVYAECGQQHPLPWEECILPHRSKGCVKIGEGTFGEVFSTTNAAGETVALKIIPIEGSEKVNGEDQKSFGEILHEVIISKELSRLKEKQHNQTCGFIGLNDLHCVQGCYPSDFLKAWDAYDRRKGSENDRPDFFTKEQLFIILEFEFGGVDLENSNGTLASLGVAQSILHQVTAALAVAEQELHFEHRDLHWGNVLVKTTRQRKASFLLNGTTHHVETKGVLVRIIDYSLSRLEIDELTVSCDISKDEELFMGQGDYQFEIYRLMRQENGNDWSSYHPHSNVLWLHYLCSKLLSMKYRSSGSRGAKDTREALSRFYDNILQYNSATDALRNCSMFT